MLEVGSVVSGKYRLVAQIGEGGMGVVYRATHEHLGHDVAVKFLAHAGADAPQWVARFLDEARISVSVRHRNVVQILDFGVAEDGRPYMVMEFLEGESLADRLGRKPPLSLAETAQTVGMVLSGLAAVHDRGIVHRDLKPENIFLTFDADGFYPKILDFGVSKDLEREMDGERKVRTREGVLLGTPQYMSPEQARGLRDIDRRSDLYSMGVILYELLTGVSPFDCENVGDVLMKVMSGDHPRLGRIRTDLPPALIEVVERAMALDRDARFEDARAMRNALYAAVSATPDGMQPFTVSDPAAAPIGDAPARPRVSVNSVDATIPFRTTAESSGEQDAPAEPATVAAPTARGPGLVTRLERQRKVPVVALGLSFSLVVGAAAVELRSPGAFGRTFAALAGGAPSDEPPSVDAGVPVLDAGVDGGTILLRLRPVPEDAVVTVGERSYAATDLAALRNPNGLVTVTLPRADEDVSVRVEVPGYEAFEDRRSMRNNISFRLRLRSLDAGIDAGVDAGSPVVPSAPPSRRGSRSLSGRPSR